MPINNAQTATTIVGVISDTHGLMRPEALDALRGSQMILHAGDIGSSGVLESLASIAPVVAVRGNVDGSWADGIPLTAVVEIGEVTIYILHDVKQIDLKPEAAGFAAVISGHSHVPRQETKNGVLYLNPGSAGPRRFKLPVSVGRLKITGKQIESEIVKLAIP
jgi:putative phosphoesterase